MSGHRMLFSDSVNILCSLHKCHFEIAVIIVLHSLAWAVKAFPLNISFGNKSQIILNLTGLKLR